MAARQHWRETGLWAGLFVWAEHRTQGLLCFVAGDPVDPLQSVPLLGVDRRVEVKCRGVGFRRLCDWLESNDFLIVRADRREPLVVIPLGLAAEIAAVAEGRKAHGWDAVHRSGAQGR